MDKKLSIAAFILLIVGVIGSIATFASTNKKAASISTDISDLSFTSIHIDVDNIDAVLLPAQEQARVEVVGQNAQKRSDKLTIDLQEDTLTIHSHLNNKKWFSFGFDPSPKLKIYVPEKEYKTIQLKGKTGDLYVEEIIGKEMELIADTGDVVGENLTFDDVSVKTSTGDIHLDSIVANTSMESKNGDVVLSDIKANTVTAKTKTGNISFKKVSGEIQAETQNGDFVVRNEQINEPITAKTSSGDISINAKEYPENVQFDTATKFGDILIFGNKKQIINNQNPGTLIQLETSSGDIVVRKK
ncbi:DUF4097 family beta strand repeat-containing protein [Lederbergia sp. NSJ-179]|uniref:DUF4097 family beta strand repeat-containing protein n=1 Tax=Lederbergia sp. NSJ-179 TaxID=2931402 RepID=UPI001FD12837|nr:DUF4097 family beta strand repeat-containing protein [Lederbergia sp. NSJ-179]MCJ7840135.1 DUF4097 family beta strand repeat-containing protein [Lederbergia sp. NSJ-179]